MDSGERFTLYNEDCRKVLPRLPADSMDSIVTDPPYGLEFMGKDWDSFKPGYKQPGFGQPDGSKFRENRGTPCYTSEGNPACRNCGGDKYRNGPGKCRCDSPNFGNPSAAQMLAFQLFTIQWAVEALRVLKPGGYLLAFGGSRTYHRLACGVEDAGFEVRDQLQWVYGSGFNKVGYIKNGDGSHVADGFGGALKPAHEPIVMARKPLIGTIADNMKKHGTGALNIDGCRVPSADGVPLFGNGKREAVGCYSDGLGCDSRTGEISHRGRWPANVTHDGSEEVLAAFPDAPGQQGDLSETGRERPSSGRFGDMAPPHAHKARIDSSKSAARFFYCAKTSKADRGEGNIHPTVKPTALMRYLCRLVTPPGGLVLDPFMGSGSTGKAALLEGFSFVGMDSDREHGYFPIAEARIRQAVEVAGKEPDLFGFSAA